MSDELTEQQTRRSEIGLMVGRLSRLTQQSDLTSDQRIGACYALQVLEHRRAVLDARKATS